MLVLPPQPGWFVFWDPPGETPRRPKVRYELLNRRVRWSARPSPWHLPADPEAARAMDVYLTGRPLVGCVPV